MRIALLDLSRRNRVVAILALTAALLPRIAAAHPMGNFSISHHAALRVEGDWLHLRYRIDFAEIPTVDEMRELNAGPAGEISATDRAGYFAKKIPELIGGLKVSGNGEPLLLSNATGDLLVRPGAGGLPTLLVTIDCSVPIRPRTERLIVEYTDTNYQSRTGWREVVATASGGWRVAQSDAANTDLSSGLTAYPTDALSAPPQQTSARVTFDRNGGKRAAIVSSPQKSSGPVQASATPRDRLAELIQPGQYVSLRTLIFSIAVAFIFGAMHALSPGHGKALVAAYLVGSRGTARHACLLGAIVTVTHTIGVFALGIAVLYASRYVLPERLYPWIGLASGLMILCVGSWQFVRRLSYYNTPDAPPVPTHEHGAFGQHLARRNPQESFSRGGLLAMGISGGIVPCPSALIVLLSAIALHRIVLGLTLIVAFSMGLASVLIVIGVVIVSARRTLDGFSVRGSWLRGVPLVSSAVVALLGAAISWQAFVLIAPNVIPRIF